MRRVKAFKGKGGTYRFWFLGKPMTFSKLCAHFEYKTNERRLKAVWFKWRRPYEITDPEFFAEAFIEYVRPVEVVGVGTFPTAKAVAKKFGVSPKTVSLRIQKLGLVLTPEDLQIDKELSERMAAMQASKRLEKNKEKAARRSPRQPMPSDEWLSFTDRPRAHTGY